MKSLRWPAGIALGALTLVGAAMLGVRWYGTRVVNSLLRDWAVETVDAQSGGAYALHLGHVRFDWARRRIAVDSIALRTNRQINADRPQALPGLQVALAGCTISGVHLVALVRRAGLIAGAFGCRSGGLVLEALDADSVVPGPRTAATPLAAERQTVLGFQQAVRLPSYAHRIRIDRIDLPQLTFDVRLPVVAGSATRLELQRLSWRMTDFVIDPADSAAAGRPLFSRTIELEATNFVSRTAAGMTVQIAMLRAGLGDSTLEIRGFGFAPTEEDGSGTPRARRRTVVALAAGHAAARGLDFRAFLLGRGIVARSITLDSLRIRIAKDRRVQPGRRRARRTPQRWIADLEQAFSVDSLLVQNGELMYREQAEGRLGQGVLTFARIEAAITDVRHTLRPRPGAAPMRIAARAHLQGAGRLDLHVEVPLDAPQFDMTISGTLGAMPATHFNRFLAETEGLRIERGQVKGGTIRVTVRNGLATGRVTPRFTDLSIAVTRTGRAGILGRGGIIGGAARGVASYAAGRMVRRNNPARPAEPPRIGAIREAFTPDQTLIGFLWRGVKGGLLSVVRT